jgi:hypothetical protein
LNERRRRRSPISRSCFPFRVPPVGVASLSVRRARLAVSHSLGFAVFPRQARELQPCNPTCLSSVSALLQSLTQRILVSQPQPADTSHGHSLPSAHQGSEVHLPQGFPCPAQFRPQGLVTLSTAYSLRTRAGFVSHRQRSWDSPFGAFPFRKVFERLRPKAPTYRFSRRFSYRRSSRPARRAAVSGLCPLRESLATRRGISTLIAGCSLGLSLPGSFAAALTGISPALLSRASRTGLERLAHRRPRVSIGSCFASSDHRGKPRRGTRQPS